MLLPSYFRSRACCMAALLLSSSMVVGQRLGIRTTTPQQAVDVNGNIKLSGTLKVNGQAGTAGQILTSTGSGLAWATPVVSANSTFSRWVIFEAVTSGTPWTVPSGVTEVMVEIWGGGGGGSSAGDGSGGGGSGAYAQAIIDVTNVSSLQVIVGAGGEGNTASNAVAGSASEVRWTRLATNYKIQAAGGEGAIAGAAGAGGRIIEANTIVPSNISLLQLPGEAGRPVYSTYSTSSDNTVVRHVTGTSGGLGYSFENYDAPGGTYGWDPTNPNTAASYFGSDSGGHARMPGQGGSSNIRTANRNADGATGLVIIRW